MNRTELSIWFTGFAAIAASFGAAAWIAPPPAAVEAAPPAAAPSGVSTAAVDRETIAQRAAALEAKLEADDRDLDDWKALGRAYMALERWSDAVKVWSYVAEAAPGDTDSTVALASLSAVAQRRGSHAEALGEGTPAPAGQ